MEDNFSTDHGKQGVGYGLRMIPTYYIYCALYFYYNYISCTSDQQALDPRGWGPMAEGIPLITLFTEEGGGKKRKKKSEKVLQKCSTICG